MKELNGLEDFFISSAGNIPILTFLFNLILSGLLALILAKTYQRFGSSLSNRKIFSRNFLLLTLTTMLVISIIKSSLALSLGLVGALSIIRFRGAIKEPEELTYLFLAIAIGLGFGANQSSITLIAFTVIVLGIISTKLITKTTDNNQNLFVTISSDNPGSINVNEIIDIANKNCTVVNLRRLDETSDVLELSFMVEFENVNSLEIMKSEIKKIDKSITFNFIDNKGIY